MALNHLQNIISAENSIKSQGTDTLNNKMFFLFNLIGHHNIYQQCVNYGFGISMNIALHHSKVSTLIG